MRMVRNCTTSVVGTGRLTQREAELETLLERVGPLLGRDADIRTEDGNTGSPNHPISKRHR